MTDPADLTMRKVSENLQQLHAELSVNSTRSVGNEIALIEVLLYLHDKGVIDKDDLVQRLERSVKHIESPRVSRRLFG